MKAYIIAVGIFFFIGYHVLPLPVYHSKLFFIVGLIVPYFITRLLPHRPESQEVARPVSAPPSQTTTERNAWPPHTADLLYPVSLPTMADLAIDGHADPRALLYSIRYISPTSKRPFSSDALDARDFGGSKDARRFLIRNGLIREISATRSLAELYSKEELRAFLRERGLPVTGSKDQLSDRLLSIGFRPEKKRRKQYELTDAGRALIEEHASDWNAAVRSATFSIKQGDYDSSISAYRNYDNRWGFVHTSGKNHTIFANFDVPFSRFDFIAFYPMRELHNSADFKKSLRACLIAGLMRGEQERIELALCFKDVCNEQIICPDIVDYFCMDDFDDASGAAIRSAMQRNVEEDSDYTLQYYISRVLRLSRQA